MAFPQTHIQTHARTSNPPENLDDDLCSGQKQEETQRNGELSVSTEDILPTCSDSPGRCLTMESRIERAWAYWTKLGRPKFIDAPMVDNSELPFRLLCRKYGAQAACTPMLHSCIFTETEKYRKEEFTTCKEDWPLFVQFCANDPDTLLDAARSVER